MSDVLTVPPERVASRILEGEAVVINLESGLYVGLNGSATALWGLLVEAPRSVGALADALATAHEADRDTVGADVQFFVEALADMGLVLSSDEVGAAVGPIGIAGPYLAPYAERYDTLDELMLSGE